MLVIIDIKLLVEQTPRTYDFHRLELIAYWLDRQLDVILPPDWHYHQDQIVIHAHKIAQQCGGYFPLSLPVNLLNVQRLDIRGNALLLTVDEHEFYERNPELWEPKSTYSNSRNSSWPGQNGTKRRIGNRSLTRF